MRWNCYEGCIHYGSQFEVREEREERRDEREFRYPPLYRRLRRMRHREFW